MDILAASRSTTATHLMETMTQAQIELRWVFYLRERARDAERISTGLAMVLAPLFVRPGG